MVHPGRFCFGIRKFLHHAMTVGLCLVATASFALAAGTSDLEKRVTDHLMAGEFGPAMTLAKTATGEEKDSLLQLIANEQRQANVTETAAAQSPRTRNSRNSRVAPGSLAGGGANFGMLMNLIQQNTSGKWQGLGDEDGGAMTPFQTGVKVSPNGLLQKQTTQELNGQLAAMGIQARQADLNSDVAQKSELRMVSLTRLEKAVAQRLEEGQSIPETMAQLAGLSQVKFVFVYPESNEIVIAGPANGWSYDGHGQPVSLNDGRPTLQLDDLVTVLRTFAHGSSDFGCSINTRDQGIKSLQEFAEQSQKAGPIEAGKTSDWVKQLQKKLGRQDVVVWGVPAGSRVARVIVEADYRMKLIGIDKLDAGKEIPSYFDLLPPAEQKAASNLDALRWWLAMKFDAVLHSEDKNAFEIIGSSVLCQSENQLLTAEGKHVPTGHAEGTNRRFAENFTNQYGNLAKKDSVFADTQNIFDLALCAALIKHEQLDQKANWDFGVFAPGAAYAPATYAVPKEIDSVVNHRVYRTGSTTSTVVVQVAGGVAANVMSVVKDAELSKSAPELTGVSNNAKAPELPLGRWWWDASK